MYLVDTNVVSDFSSQRPDEQLATWFAATPERHLFISSMTFGEIRNGIERLRPREPDRAAALELWMDSVTLQFASRILPVDTAVAEQWGRLEAVRPVPFVDGLIAATALAHDLVVATRNVRDFESLGVATYNPFGA